MLKTGYVFAGVAFEGIGEVGGSYFLAAGALMPYFFLGAFTGVGIDLLRRGIMDGGAHRAMVPVVPQEGYPGTLPGEKSLLVALSKMDSSAERVAYVTGGSAMVRQMADGLVKKGYLTETFTLTSAGSSEVSRLGPLWKEVSGS